MARYPAHPSGREKQRRCAPPFSVSFWVLFLFIATGRVATQTLPYQKVPHFCFGGRGKIGRPTRQFPKFNVESLHP